MIMFNKHDLTRDACMLTGRQSRQGYDWWWHSFTGRHAVTGEEKAFFVEFFLCNPARGGKDPVFGQLPENKEKGLVPSYLMIKAGAWGRDAGQLHRFFGWEQLDLGWDAPYHVAAGDCYAGETELRGSISVSP